MCGIGGILRLDGRPAERPALERMRDALGCRGPDGHGFFVDGPCGLVHTRLAVIDPATGAQPMTAPASTQFGAATVVFNGEIYNHAELRRKLTLAGHRFATHHSDTEVLLHGRREWGRDLPQQLSGMFAFALWDGRSRSLLLVRDRVGKKPLYVHNDGTTLCFASTLAAVVAGVGRGEINAERLSEYLAFGYTAQASLLSNIQELPPAHRGLISLDGSGKTERYWRTPDTGKPTTADEVERLLEEAVESRLEADVPLGCFLSGGIDSSLVASIAQKKLAERGGRLRTFSVSMPDARYDEGPWARRVAEHLGCDHTELLAEPNVEEDLLEIIRTTGEPTGDSSILPTYWLSKATRPHVTVALSGDGGDELFGGYERYRAMRLLRRHAWWLRRVPTFLLGGEQKSSRARLRRLVEASRFSTDAERYASIVRLFSDEQLAALGMDVHRVDGGALTPALSQGERGSDPADAVRRWDFENYLPFDLLRKVDRASMAVALEVRCPMLDTALVEAALRTPMKVLMPGRTTKPLLREIAKKHLPAEIIERKKMGFAVPIGPWFRGGLQPLLYKWLLDAPALPSLGLNRASIELLITEHASGKLDHTHRLFALLTLAMWAEENP